MNTQELAVNKRTALMMFWNAGVTTEEGMLKASQKLEASYQPSAGYWYAKDISKMLEKV